MTLWCSCATGSSQSEASTAPDSSTVPASAPESVPAVEVKDTIPFGAQRLLDAYPDAIREYRDNKLIFADGSELVFDDGREKDFVTMLDNSDPQDMFFTGYDTLSDKPGYLNDCGRSRCEALFKKLYGSSAAAVQKQMVPVQWFGQTIRFSGSHGAAKALEKVRDELSQKPELRKYLTGASTFYWRPVRGAKRLSAHSYGMAVDINTSHSDYWLWKNPKAGETAKIAYVNRIPLEVVKVFEKHGFVWGGRWYHFDTMHFEYRPELNPPVQ